MKKQLCRRSIKKNKQSNFCITMRGREDAKKARKDEKEILKGHGEANGHMLHNSYSQLVTS